MSAKLESGEDLEPSTYGIPLATFAGLKADVAHLTVRYPEGKFGGPLQAGVDEILTDYWLPGMFIKTGMWTFKIEAILPGMKGHEDRYLFAFQGSQWLEGQMR